MPRTATEANETNNLPVGKIELEPPSPLTAEQVQALVARSVADALAGAVPAMMAEMMKSAIPSTPGLPSPNVHISGSPEVEGKSEYLKKYRLDGVTSGKYQMINMAKLNGRDIDDLDSEELKTITMKGKWFHFVGDGRGSAYAFAVSDNDVEFVENYLKPRGVRVYEDEGGFEYPCPVVNCGLHFSTNNGLMNHMAATHGVGPTNA